jgi:integrase
MPSKAKTLARLCAEYAAHAARVYRHEDGTQTGQAANIRCTLRFLLERVGGQVRVSDLKRSDLTDFMQAGVRDHDWTRGYANAQLARVKHMLKWACENDDTLWTPLTSALNTAPLRAVRSGARESTPRNPPPLATIWRVLRRLPNSHREILTVVALTGARLGEIVSARVADYRDYPVAHLDLGRRHKSGHRGHVRLIPLSGEAAKIVAARARAASGSGSKLIFPPERAGCTMRCKNRIRVALAAACEREGVRLFRPHDIRHAVAREVRVKSGLDAAQALLGHKSPTMTAHYAPLPISAGVDAAVAIANRHAAMMAGKAV